MLLISAGFAYDPLLLQALSYAFNEIIMIINDVYICVCVCVPRGNVIAQKLHIHCTGNLSVIFL